MTRYLLLIALAAGLVLPGCGKEEESTPSTPATPDAGGMMDAMKQAASSIDVSKYTAQLSAIEPQIDKLKEMAKTKADAQLNTLVDQVVAKLDTAKTKIASLKDAEGGTADALKKEVEALLPELQKLFDQAMAKAKELGVSMPGM